MGGWRDMENLELEKDVKITTTGKSRAEFRDESR